MKLMIVTDQQKVLTGCPKREFPAEHRFFWAFGLQKKHLQKLIFEIWLSDMNKGTN